MEIGRDWGLGSDSEKKRPDEAEACRVLNGVLDLGVNIIDTASAYHLSEERVGKCVGHRTSQCFIATKCGEHNRNPSTYYDFSYNAVKSSIDRSLDILKIDRIDLMQIHFGPDAEKVLNDGETLQAMKDAQEEGKINYLGASASDDIAERCIDSGDFNVLQLEHNLIYRNDEHLIRKCKERGLGVLIRGGLARGLLTPKILKHLNYAEPKQHKKLKHLLNLVDNDANTLLSLALHFLFENDGITSVLIGSKNLSHVKFAIHCMNHSFDNDILKKAIDISF